jgi:methylated-DNA-[protein]-cysteine S-methyltransferase
MATKTKTTPFQERVYAITRKIPRGQTMTYGEIAKILKSSPRAVGQALKRNPYAPIVPCHRVIKSDGTLGGFNGKMNSKKKIKLLKNEGVQFKKGIKI